MANKLEINPETTIKWTDSGGDEVLQTNNLAFQAGWNGGMHDWLAAPRPFQYHAKIVAQFATAPLFGEVVRVYIKPAGIGGSATDPANDDGDNIILSDINKLNNLQRILTLTVDQEALNIIASKEAWFENVARHFAVVIFNDSAGGNLRATANASFVEITPAPMELQ